MSTMKFKKPLNVIEGERRQARAIQENKPQVDCEECKKKLLVEDLGKNYFTCAFCGNHFRIGARARINKLIDEGTFVELDKDLESKNILDFSGYDSKIESGKKTSGEKEAVLTGTGELNKIRAAFFFMEPSFMMGSMGSIVGEKITRLFEHATKEKLPVIGFCLSGGARMQEGILSLMQMAKTGGAVGRHSDAGQLFISILTNPTTGGVTASFASLGDIIIAEPNALIGFAGPRVIEQTMRKKLPGGFQRAEFMQSHGFVDAIIERTRQKEILTDILKMHITATTSNKKISENKDTSKKISITSDASTSISAYQKVKLARAKERATCVDYFNFFNKFIEFHGDRAFGDDQAIIGGIGLFEGRPVTVIGIERGKETKDKINRNFGMPHPEGYRKALRLMKQAEKFNRPIVCFIDTSGAYCGMEAEERGQGQAIATNLCEMMKLTVPVLSIVIGEGGSGGALALAVANEVHMLENSIYSVISPEGCASILWKDASKIQEACENLKCTSSDLLGFGVIEEIIPESGQVFDNVKTNIESFLDKYDKLSTAKIVEQRYTRFRKIGGQND